MISLTINDQKVEVPEGTTLLQAATQIGITIPTLCFHKDLSPFGGCRLCVVDVKGSRLPMTACTLPVSPEMVVQTETETITRYRRAVLRMLLTNYYDAGYKRNNGDMDIDQDNELAHWAQVYDVDIHKYMARKPSVPVDSDPNPFVWVDMNKCIQCTRCVRACGEVQGRFVWSQSFRGYKARIVAGADTTMLQARCESCGACVAYCPTGALDNKMSVSAGRADRLVRTTCTYCGVGCQLDLNIRDDVPGGRVIRVTSNHDPDTVNGRHLCLKGRYGYEFIHSQSRLTRPRVRQYLLDGSPRPRGLGKWVEVDWKTALEAAAAGLHKTRTESGGESIGVLASGKLLNEENYLLNKLARQVLGTNHIDCCAAIYSGSTIAGLIDAAGLPAMSNSFDQIANQAGSLLVIGSNLTEQHPVFGAHIRQAILRRKVKMVVASPDFINIAEYASLPLYHHPHSEVALINGLMHIILEKGWGDPKAGEADPRGFAAFKKCIDEYTPGRTAQLTGVSVEALYKAAEIIAKHPPLAVIWSVGLEDHQAGKRNVQSLVNLQRLLGGLDLPGGGLNPLIGQNNLLGAYDLGAAPDTLPGYQRLANTASRRLFEQAWGTSLPAKPGLSAWEMLASARAGAIKALYILGEDILNVSTSGALVRRGLEECGFVILQAAASSDTDRYADILLPGVSFAEKTGTFTSTERRIQAVNKAIEPIGGARPDWQVISDLASRIQALADHQPEKAEFSGWDYPGTAEIMLEIAALTPIYAGVSHQRLAEGGSLQWPVAENDHPGTDFLKSGFIEPVQSGFIPVEQIAIEKEELKPPILAVV